MGHVSKVDFSKFKVLPIDRCVKAPWNYKNDDEAEKISLIESIKGNGQIENIQVRLLDTGFYEVVNGNHRLDAMKELNFQDIIVYDHGKISETKAQLLAAQTNEVRFSIDQIKYSQMLKEIAKDYDLEAIAKLLAKSEADVKHMIDLLDFKFDDFETQTAPTEPDEFETLTLRLPKELVEQFNQQIIRIKKQMYPDQKPENVSIVLPFECFIQHIAQLPDSNLI